MNTDQLTPVAKRWLRHTEATPPDARRSARQVMARMPYVRQRGRWWPLPTFGHRTSSAPTTSDHEHRSEATPATTDHFPTIIGRTQTMFSPVKAISVGAVVFAIGGVLLIAQPFDQGGSVPGAEQAAEPAPPVEVTITYTEGPSADPEVCTTRSADPAARVDVDASACTRTGSSQFSATDPRLSGMATEWVIEYYWPGTGWIFEAYAIEVANDEGRWVGTGRYVGAALDLLMYTLTGEGGYEGLSAVLTDPQEEDEEVMTGVIVEGGLPPFPEPAD